LYTGTLAGAQALDSAARFGNLDRGKDADLVLVDASAWPPLAAILGGVARTAGEGAAVEATLFALLMGLREPAITGVFVRGHEISSSPVR
ncbi:hypothetical protein ACSNOK_34440, partial [Streptomyces sp. URMC 126]